jgi:hypothetical protein
MNRPLEQIPQHLNAMSNARACATHDTSPRIAARAAARTFIVKVSGALLGLLLAVAAPGMTLAGEGEPRFADLGYADRVAPLRAAAKNNDVHAQETLGFMYLCAESRCAPGVARDLDEARYWLSRAAAQGSMVAAYQLAWMRGEGQPMVAIKSR